MKNINFLLICIAAIMVSFSFSSCSKDDDKEDIKEIIKIDGKNHKILQAGYSISADSDITCIQFIIEDFEENDNRSTIEIQMPTTLTEEWFTLLQDNSHWKILLRNTYVGNGKDMGVISEGRVLIKKIGNNDEENKCKFRVSFEISLTDGTRAVADIQTKFRNSVLWIGGK